MRNQKSPVSGAPGVAVILDRLEALGLKSTRARKLIAARIAELAGREVDFTIEDLWKELQQQDPGIGRATVYRTIELLQREGLIDRVGFADGTHRYRLCGTSHHHHVTCVTCQRVVEVDACLPAEVLSRVAEATDFAIEGHSLEIFGRCSECQR